MHFHQKTAQLTSLNGFRVLVILLIAHATCVTSSQLPTAEEIAEIRNEVLPTKYCGRRLNEAMKFFCQPIMKNLILRQSGGIVKKSYSSPDLDFETFDVDRVAAENYDDEMARSHYKIDDTYYSNDLPFMFSSQAANRRRRGIIEECCKRPCYKSELISYCPLTKANG